VHRARWAAGLTAAAAMALAVIPQTTAAAITPPTVAVIGDSFTAAWTGTNPTTTSTPWYQYTASDLGWHVGNVIADPGAGCLARGWYGTIAQALTAHPIAANTNYVLLQAGLNDDNLSDPNAIDAAVANVLSIIRLQAPNAVPIVIGSFDPIPSGNYGPQEIPVARHIGDAQSIGSTRYTIALMCTFEVSADGTHPTARGHQQIGDWVAWHIAHGLDNGTPLHQDPTGSFYTV